MMPPDVSVAALHAALRTVPDFPSPGIQFRDITPILADPALLEAAIELLAAPYRGRVITKVAAMEARGFVLGAVLARELGAGFIPIRKKGKLPYETHVAYYSLEYGADALEVHTDACQPGDVVLIHDDVIATGGTALAALDLVQAAGGQVAGYSFLIELTALGGRTTLEARGIPVYSVLAL
ncbi:MAG: adenine phosphoribosyltransferase [Rhodothermales bacterium]|nr:adenine phosphoribosyltransferase [Rhodothermales bacterium]